ncbi:MAG: hypothetical protein WAZ48_01225 [Lysobacteraceae bacterium]
MTPDSNPPPEQRYRRRMRYALAVACIGLAGVALYMARNNDLGKAPTALDTSAASGSADAKTWALDAVPEDELALRLAQEAAQRLAQPPANHIPVRANDMPRPPRDALAALPPPPQSFASATAPHQPPSENPGGVNGNRPARPIPGF